MLCKTVYIKQKFTSIDEIKEADKNEGFLCKKLIQKFAPRLWYNYLTFMNHKLWILFLYAKYSIYEFNYEESFAWASFDQNSEK